MGAGTVEKGWQPFRPQTDEYKSGAQLDLRSLNEKVAGENGFIQSADGQFIQSKTKNPIRFFAVNGPFKTDDTPENLRKASKFLAKHGVNMVRVHRTIFDDIFNVDPAEIARRQQIVGEMKSEGIYTELSIYFPLWLTPRPDHPTLKGYDGKKNPFGAIFFNEEFQKQYFAGWEALLTTPDENGKKLVDEPALMGLEIINEDSCLFGTFVEKNLPPPLMDVITKKYGDWLTKKYGSIDKATSRWKSAKVSGDDFPKGKVGIRPIWNMANERTLRDQDTVTFLFEVQRDFYQKNVDFLRKLGFKGVITASNWTTASGAYFGAIERMSYMPGDFIDRHGYFSSNLEGEGNGFSIRPNQTYKDRSALRFDPEKATDKEKSFSNPIMDMSFGDKPSMISEMAWTAPNRFRSEAPLYCAAYGALQGTDALVFFAMDSDQYRVKPTYWMRPWPMATPADMAQYPAASLIHRKSLVKEAKVIAKFDVSSRSLLELKGFGAMPGVNLDDLRKGDAEAKENAKTTGIDPLAYFVGRVKAEFSADGNSAQIQDMKNYINRDKQTVLSETGELKLDYGNGVLTINAPCVRAASGFLGKAGAIKLGEATIQSPMEFGHIAMVSLDDQPIEKSGRILVQAMSETKPSGWATQGSGGKQKITSIGTDPWIFRDISGTVKLGGGGGVRVMALDFNGYPLRALGAMGEGLDLAGGIVYYILSR